MSRVRAIAGEIVSGMLARSCEAEGLKPAGPAASAVVDRAARERHQRRLDDLMALSHAGRQLQIDALRAYYAAERYVPTADETLREAMAALDTANGLAKRVGQ